jgi:hypothetical protein
MSKPISPLRQRMIDDMAFRNMSPSTHKVYTYAVANFSECSPGERSDTRGPGCASCPGYRYAHPGYGSRLAVPVHQEILFS